ncbi:methyltransferase type 11 [Microcystis aeruginosa NIES-3806]|uniref:Methyltransferase type 11 n=1 Tax=Microcystis aeruginosa NIES-3807 TaxID=2517785 RepID=A0AAD3B0Q4_MICAE|nr:class I SAM-dependent methyltransferase [Microcystis aeruginosa]GCL53951.1 methyltransferase type 11 [Microcystis aeruginosa NIES-3806]GCL59209.1 methyltransferase type 11 [Microcystis aeruginosa NIES-3807]
MNTHAYTYNNLLFAELYDFIIEKIGRGNNMKVWEFFPRCAEIFGSPILEMGCGTGINLLPLAEMGYPVTGLDISSAMLKFLEQKLQKASPEVRQNVEFVEGDMVNPPLKSNYFRLIIFAQSQFLHLHSDEQRLTCLQNTRRLLVEDGVVLLCNGKLEQEETWEQWREVAGNQRDEWRLFTRSSWQNGSLEEEIKLQSNSDPQQEHSFNYRLYPIPNERMLQLIKQAGLRPAPIPANLPANFYERFKMSAFTK